MHEDQQLSPDVVLRRAAAGDAARSRELLGLVGASRLLDAVISQAELASDDERPRAAGIDAIAELDRAAIEVMHLPQIGQLDVDLDGSWPRGPSDSAGAGLAATATLVGWELDTCTPSSLSAVAHDVDARPWHLALIAFADQDSGDAVERRVVAAVADGRLVAGTLRFTAIDEDAELVDASVTRDSARLPHHATALASVLARSLREAIEGG